MNKHITGFSNPTVKYLRSLRDKKHRKRAGQFLVEGLRLLEDARVSGHIPRQLVMAEGRDAHALIDQLESAVDEAGGEVIFSESYDWEMGERGREGDSDPCFPHYFRSRSLGGSGPNFFKQSGINLDWVEVARSRQTSHEREQDFAHFHGGT